MRSWRTSSATAWEHPLVEWARTATSYCSIVLDCDSRESQELACAVEAGYGDLPRLAWRAKAIPSCRERAEREQDRDRDFGPSR